MPDSSALLRTRSESEPTTSADQVPGEAPPDLTQRVFQELQLHRTRLLVVLAAMEDGIREVGRLICPDCEGTGKRRVRSGLYPAYEVWDCHCPLGWREREDSR
jgi:hypothetical protein